MAIRLGTLLPNSTELGIGVNRARKGFALMADGTQELVIAKRVGPNVLAAEIFCSSLGRAANLPIPEPVIIKDPMAAALMFGSVFQGYPNLMQAFRLDPASASNEELLLVAKRIAQWTRVNDAIGFDEWVSNVDRNLQNLLWDGFDHFVMIDHDKCLGHRVAGRADQNYLLAMTLGAIMPDQAEIERLKMRVLAAVMEFENEFAEAAATALQRIPIGAAASHSQAYFSFVTQRLPQLARLLATKFPSVQLSLEV